MCEVCSNCPNAIEDCYPDTPESCWIKELNYPHLMKLRIPEKPIKEELTRFNLLEID